MTSALWLVCNDVYIQCLLGLFDPANPVTDVIIAAFNCELHIANFNYPINCLMMLVTSSFLTILFCYLYLILFLGVHVMYFKMFMVNCDQTKIWMDESSAAFAKKGSTCAIHHSVILRHAINSRVTILWMTAKLSHYCYCGTCRLEALTLIVVGPSFQMFALLHRRPPTQRSPADIRCQPSEIYEWTSHCFWARASALRVSAVGEWSA